MEGEAIAGTCYEMCPAKETAFRRRERLLHPMEKGRELVKAYSRPAAGQDTAEPSQLRPFPTLLWTVRYLLGPDIADPRHDWPTVYGFVMDRLRAVRQDMVIQRLKDREAGELLLEMAPWLFRSLYRARTEATSSFDAALHGAQLSEVLHRLAAAAAALPDELRGSAADLLCLHQAAQPRPALPALPPSALVRRLAKALRLGNLARVGRLCGGLAVPLRPVALSGLGELRLRTLRAVAVAFRSGGQRLRLAGVVELLWLDDEPHAQRLLASQGLVLDDHLRLPMAQDFSPLAKLQPSSLPADFHLASSFIDAAEI